MHSGQDESIEHELLRVGSVVEFELLTQLVELTVGQDDTYVQVVLKIPEDDVEVFAFALVYTLGVLSFHDGRPRGFSGAEFEDADQWTTSDMLRGLEFARGRLLWHADYVRGRCVKTTVEVFPDGRVVITTVNRGEAALRWVDRLKGKTYLQAVE